MSQELINFFAKITADKALQERLYVTKEIADVAVIAQEMGFQISGADILRAQAGRVMSLPEDELNTVASGNKAKTGAQWGRGGKGYLDSAGFWLIEINHWGYSEQTSDSSLQLLITKIKEEKSFHIQLLTAKSFEDIADVARRNGFNVIAGDLLRYQAAQILKLSDEQAERVARGR
ncbi:MAG: Nif11-like leader peptide family natural product precursor [Parachlamydiaceae bacterium]|nr:Nif11-like leader peptide family natural product precursor [Parachlamydiaceae bacterium]